MTAHPGHPVDTVEQLEGMFVGALNDPDLVLFEEAVKAGRAYRSYEGAAGLMGLARVRLRR